MLDFKPVLTKSILFTILFFEVLCLAQDSTEGEMKLESPESSGIASATGGEFAQEFTCALGKVGSAGPAERGQYFARVLGDFFGKMSKPPSPTWRRHLAAQMLAETGNLKDIVEKTSQYASSKLQHKGRGGIQITHAGNYAAFGGFMAAYKRSGGSSVDLKQLVAAPANQSAIEVQSPDSAFDEKTPLGQERNVLAGVWYFANTATKHPKFAEALEKSDESSVREVGVAVNKGPGKLGSGTVPLADKERKDRFDKIGECYKDSKPKEPFVGV